MKRNDDIITRGAHLQHLDDQQLNERFWELTKQLVDPLLKLASTSTSPSIERSVAMRMGASSIEATRLVFLAQQQMILEYGIGHFLCFIAKTTKQSLREVIVAAQDELYFVEQCKRFKEAMQ